MLMVKDFGVRDGHESPNPNLETPSLKPQTLQFGWQSPDAFFVTWFGLQAGKLPWRKAGPPNHLDDKVDSDQ